jgi:FkbH-like protein
VSKDERSIKCLVWDLDNTLWPGTLLEGDDAGVADAVRAVVLGLDERGILQSIASRNEAEPVLAKLREQGLADYFLYPEIHWGAKSESIRRIASRLNLALDAFAFVDDQPFERAEVGHGVPEVLCLDAREVPAILERPEFQPRFVTDESRMRRLMYAADIDRKRAESEFSGHAAEFMAGLQMRFTVGRARLEDLRRAEELTLRTHQLNTTGYTYSYDELAALHSSPRHLLLTASLEDRFGSYGTIGLALVECEGPVWTLRLLLMSCRVMSRGVGNVLLSHLVARAREAGARLRAEFVPTDRNRMMLVTLRFAGFREIGRAGRATLLESDVSSAPAIPDWLVLVDRDGASAGTALAAA